MTMEVLVSRGCGLDVHQATVVACLLTGEPGKLPRKQVKTFSTMTSGLIELRDWLAAADCTAVAIQNCFSNTVIPSRSPVGVLRRPATVSVLPSAESVYLRRTLNASDFHSTVNASPSHFAVALAEPEGNSTAVSFPSVVYFASTF